MTAYNKVMLVGTGLNFLPWIAVSVKAIYNICIGEGSAEDATMLICSIGILALLIWLVKTILEPEV